MTFTTHPALARALASRGFETATAVQLAVLQAETANRDLLVSAQTGSGKTVAFGMAFAAPLLGESERFPAAAEPMALVIAPTRELAMQVQRELAWLYAEAGARVVTCVGGMDARAEARQLNTGAHIVVGTPGRLRDHLERKRLDLTKLRSIVLDEADEMLDLGFREDLEFILDATPPTRQTLLFSATMPREIEALARRYQRDAVRIQTVRQDEQHADIEYRAIRVSPHDIENAIVNVLRFQDSRATLVFCATREAVKRMHARLVERGFSAVALSGELSQSERTQALQLLRDGRARVLVATDVAARGLDLPDLALVIHAELPNDHETLLHRSGRTGRAGRKGMCVLMVPYNRRRKAEALLGAARLKVTWGAPPTADEIRARDQERFLQDAVFTEPPTEEDIALARILQGARSADEIAIALARMHRASLPAPEDLAADTGPPPRREDRMGAERGGYKPRYEGSRFEDQRSAGAPERAGPRRPRAVDNQDMVWFRINIGRERNADARWLLPLICRAGNVTKAEVGAIKIFERDTRFQIARDMSEQFEVSVRLNATKEGNISRSGPPSDMASTPRESADTDAPAASDAPRRQPPRDRAAPAHHKKPYAAKGQSAPHARDHSRPARPLGPDGPRPKSKFAHKKKQRTIS